MSKRKVSGRGGFSMLELLLVLLLGATLLGLIVPVVYSAQQVRLALQTRHNLRVMALGCHNHNDVFRRLPPAFDTFYTFKQASSIHIHLLPYVGSVENSPDEMIGLYRKFEKGKGADIKISAYILTFRTFV